MVHFLDDDFHHILLLKGHLVKVAEVSILLQDQLLLFNHDLVHFSVDPCLELIDSQAEILMRGNHSPDVVHLVLMVHYHTKRVNLERMPIHLPSGAGELRNSPFVSS